jgi:hypothetical protein
MTSSLWNIRARLRAALDGSAMPLWLIIRERLNRTNLNRGALKLRSNSPRGAERNLKLNVQAVDRKYRQCQATLERSGD